MTDLTPTPEPNAPLLSVRDLSACYSDGKTVLHGVNLTVMPGEVVGIIGESGCGKTTLIRCILRLLPAGAKVISGEIHYSGTDILACGEKAISDLRGKEIAYIPQDCAAAFNDYLTIRRMLIEFLGRKREADLFSLLEKVHLPGEKALLDSYPFELSGGMKQRLLMAVALGMRPRLLIADEPTSSIDAPLRREILRELMEVKEDGNVALLLITHNIADLSSTADRIVVIRSGQIVEAGPVPTVFSSPQQEYTQALIAGTCGGRMT